MIKAIETRYKGYRFRSRLEARWAVFFDTLGLEWEYEPEGFKTSAGWYLPDFKVQHLGWFEVKPLGGADSLKDVTRWMAFAKDLAPLRILEGVPEPRPHLVYELMGDTVEVENWCFDMKYLPPRNHDGNPRLFEQLGSPDDALFRPPTAAFTAAKSARFEHLT